jgi:hypothetical protein
VQVDIAEHMRHEGGRGEDFRKRLVADAEAPGIGAVKESGSQADLSVMTAPLFHIALNRRVN